MRTLLMTVVMLGIGCACGWLQTSAEFSGMQERFVPHNGSNYREMRAAQVASETGKSLAPQVGSKVVVLNGETHDFGTMERKSKGRHDFVFRNDGVVPLRLQSGGTSCAACTVSSMPKTTLDPGEEMKVTVEFETAVPENDYHKEAYILTSDPDRGMVLLVVKGNVTQKVRVEPEEVTLGSIPTTEAVQAKFHVLVGLERPMKIVKHEFAQLDSSRFYELELVRLPDEEAVKFQGTLQAYEATLKVKPGLPLGSILQTIQLTTDWPEFAGIEVPIRGNVVSDISLMGGKNFDPKSNVLSLGLIPQGKGAKATVPLLVKGPHRQDVKLSVGSVDPPASLKVSIGEPKTISDGAVLMYMVTVEVPTDSPPVNRTGGEKQAEFGRIVIETTHPEAKQVQMLVKFAVKSAEGN